MSKEKKTGIGIITDEIANITPKIYSNDKSRLLTKNEIDILTQTNPEYIKLGISPKELELEADVNTNVSTNTIRKTLSERLGINVVSIVIGALFFVILIAWVDVIRSATSDILDEDVVDRYSRFGRKVWSAIIATLGSLFIIIIIYTWYKSRM